METIKWLGKHVDAQILKVKDQLQADRHVTITKHAHATHMLHKRFLRSDSRTSKVVVYQINVGEGWQLNGPVIW